MTISPWLIYFADKADSIGYFFITMAVIFFVIQIFILVEHQKVLELEQAKKNNKDVQASEVSMKTFWTSVVFLTLFAIMPSTSTCYKMFIIPKVVNSQLVQKLPDYLTSYIEKELKGATDEQ